MTRAILVGLFLWGSNARAESLYSIFVPEAAGVPGAYHDRDIRNAFPALRKTDRKLSVCSNSMMSRAAKITYFGIPTDREVILKTTSCKGIARGLMCQRIQQSKAYYFESPGQHFVTFDDVSYDDAARVIAAYKANGITNASDELRTWWNYRHVRAIGRTAHGFKLYLGDNLCGGCSAKVDVILDERGTLVLEQVLEAGCI